MAIVVIKDSEKNNPRFKERRSKRINDQVDIITESELGQLLVQQTELEETPIVEKINSLVNEEKQLLAHFYFGPNKNIWSRTNYNRSSASDKIENLLDFTAIDSSAKLYTTFIDFYAYDLAETTVQSNRVWLTAQDVLDTAYPLSIPAQELFSSSVLGERVEYRSSNTVGSKNRVLDGRGLVLNQHVDGIGLWSINFHGLYTPGSITSPDISQGGPGGDLGKVLTAFEVKERFVSTDSFGIERVSMWAIDKVYMDESIDDVFISSALDTAGPRRANNSNLANDVINVFTQYLNDNQYTYSFNDVLPGDNAAMRAFNLTMSNAVNATSVYAPKICIRFNTPNMIPPGEWIRSHVSGSFLKKESLNVAAAQAGFNAAKLQNPGADLLARTFNTTNLQSPGALTLSRLTDLQEIIQEDMDEIANEFVYFLEVEKVENKMNEALWLMTSMDFRLLNQLKPSVSDGQNFTGTAQYIAGNYVDGSLTTGIFGDGEPLLVDEYGDTIPSINSVTTQFFSFTNSIFTSEYNGSTTYFDTTSGQPKDVALSTGDVWTSRPFATFRTSYNVTKGSGMIGQVVPAVIFHSAYDNSFSSYKPQGEGSAVATRNSAADVTTKAVLTKGVDAFDMLSAVGYVGIELEASFYNTFMTSSNQVYSGPTVASLVGVPGQNEKIMTVLRRPTPSDVYSLKIYRYKVGSRTISYQDPIYQTIQVASSYGSAYGSYGSGYGGGASLNTIIGYNNIEYQELNQTLSSIFSYNTYQRPIIA